MIYGNGLIDWAIPLMGGGNGRYSSLPNRNTHAMMHSLEARYQGKYGLSQTIREMAVHYHELSSRDKTAVIAALDSLYWAWRDPKRDGTQWHTTTFYEGFIVQHAPLKWRTIHGHAGNPYSTGHEAEGIAPEPLTPAQVTANLRLLRDISDWQGKPFTRASGRVIEHRERGPTACPGDRYLPLYRALDTAHMGDDEMTPDEREYVLALGRIVAGWGELDKPRDDAAVMARIKELDARNINVLLAVQNVGRLARPLARIVAGWGQVDDPTDSAQMLARVEALDARNINILLAVQRVNAVVHDIEDALGDLSSGQGLSENERAAIASRLREMGDHMEGVANALEGNDDSQ